MTQPQGVFSWSALEAARAVSSAPSVASELGKGTSFISPVKEGTQAVLRLHLSHRLGRAVAQAVNFDVDDCSATA